MKILIYGVGAIGGFLGAYLQKTNHDIYFISRGDTLSKLKKTGLKLKSILGDQSYTDIKIDKTLPREIIFDIIIISVKLYDLKNVILKIKNNIKKNTIILPFQNGIFAENLISKELNIINNFGAVAQISVSLNKKKEVLHHGKLATFFIGNMNKSKINKKLTMFTDDCQSIGLDVRYTEGIDEKLWDKFIFLSAYSGLTTLTELTIGQIFSNKRYKKMFLDAMQETFELSKYFNVDFKKNPVETWSEKIKNMPYDMTSSMYIDFKNNRKLELNWLSGFVVESSKNLGINSETHNKILEGINSK